MTGFDIIVLALVGLGAAGGFARGFVQEVLSLAVWALAAIAIWLFHAELSATLLRWLDSPSAATVLAFVLLLLIPYAILGTIAARAGSASRKSVLGPIDRVLGLGFGALKGLIVMVMLFSLVALGYDSIWGEAGRPEWMREARTYPLINAGSDAMVELIGERRAGWPGSDIGEEEAAAE